MGFEYKIIQTERKILDRVTCDRCSIEIKKTSDAHWNEYGEPFTNFFEPHFAEFIVTEHSFGYNSSKDGETHKTVLCEPCYDAVFREIPNTQITNYF